MWCNYGIAAGWWREICMGWGWFHVARMVEEHNFARLGMVLDCSRGRVTIEGGVFAGVLRLVLGCVMFLGCNRQVVGSARYWW